MAALGNPVRLSALFPSLDHHQQHTGRPAGEQSCCCRVLGRLSIVESLPVFFPVLQQGLPRLKAIGNFLILPMIQYEYVLARDAGIVRGFQCVRENLGFYDQKIHARCFEGVIQLVGLV